MIVQSNAIVRIAHKDIVDKYLAAAHHIYTVTPSFTTEGLQIFNRNSCGTTSKYGIMVRIHYCNAIYPYIFGISDFNAPYSVVYDSPSDDADILGFVYHEFCLDHSSGGQIYGCITWYPYLIVG